MVRYVLGYPGKYGAVKLSERSKSEGGFASDCTLIPAKLSVGRYLWREFHGS